MVPDGQSGDSAPAEQPQGGASPPSDTSAPSAKASNRPKVRIVLDKGTATVGRIKTGSAGTFYSRLSAVDFMNSAFVFAVLFMISFFPFLAVLDAAAGRNIGQTIIIRLGLNDQAAKAVGRLISSGHQTVAALTVLGAAFLVLFALGIPAILQTWYQRVYDQPAPHGGAVKQIVCRLLWIAALLAYDSLLVLVGRQVGPAGGHVLIFACEFAITVFFWWWTVHFLLLGSIGWRALFPAAVATGFCLTGLGVFSALLLSGSIISGEKTYGPIGVVTVLLSYLIGYAVCLHLGAVFGRMWSERRESPDSARSDRETNATVAK